MAVGSGAVRGRGFFGNLLLGGVSVIELGARVPSELAADPAPQPAWRRMALLVGLANATTRTFGGSDAASDGLMRRASRYLLLGPLTWRLLAVPIPVLGLAIRYGAGRLGPVLGLAALLFGISAAMVVVLLRSPDLPVSLVRTVLVADLAIGAGAGLLAGAALPAGNHRDVFLGYFAGTVALWTGALGVRGGLVPIALGVPVQVALTRLAGSAAGHGVAATVVGRLAWLTMALVIMILVLALMGLGTRLAMLVGMRAGRQVERTRLLRDMHDTVLQTLEAMALSAGRDRADPAAALAELRGMARGQAARLRHALGELTEHREAALADELADVAAEIAGLGLRTELVVADIDDRGLASGSRHALRDAVREALRNTVKHAGTSQAVVRVDGVAGGVEVVIRDHGTGFAVNDGAYGFGITQSIVGRLREVGGRASVQSWPGRGTRVTMWVPL
jgi:signal transduction histidine kinase